MHCHCIVHVRRQWKDFQSKYKFDLSENWGHKLSNQTMLDVIIDHLFERIFWSCDHVRGFFWLYFNNPWQSDGHCKFVKIFSEPKFSHYKWHYNLLPVFMNRFTLKLSLRSRLLRRLTLAQPGTVLWHRKHSKNMQLGTDCYQNKIFEIPGSPLS